MGLFTLVYDGTTAKQALTAALENLRREVTDGDASTFFTTLLKSTGGAPDFFRQLFNERGEGSAAFGDSWKPLSSLYKQRKEKEYGESRIGFKTHALFLSLTVPGATGNVLTVSRRSATYGSNLKQAVYFDSKRPVITATEAAEFKQFLIEGAGRSTYQAAVEAYKSKVLEAVSPTRGIFK